jgi:TolB-like protein/DNA-binding winged helix-turn-helix (wHTH) protein
VSFGLFTFDVDTGELRRDGVAVRLAPQPARVLALLVSRPGELIPRDELRRELWGEDTFVDFERGLNFCITQARAALGDSSDNPRFIQTVPRRGYRFIAPVAPVSIPSGVAETAPLMPSPPPAMASLPVGRAAEIPSPAAARARANRPGWVAGAAVLALVLGGAWAWGTRSFSHTPSALTAMRVAVMPFANLTGDPDADYVADALTDEVIMHLGTFGRDRLAVIARTSAMRYRTQPKTVKEIGRELGVAYVVESSVRRVGQSLRLSSRIITVDSETGMASWEEVFDAVADAAETQQTHAAIRMARRIAASLLPEDTAAAGARTTRDPAAWDAFLHAAALMNRGTPTDVAGAIAQLNDAVQRDPGFAAAWARLAEAHHVLVMMGRAAPDEAYPSARDAAKRAIAAAGDLPAAHLAQGLVALWYDWRPADAAASFERALALNESFAAAHHDYAWALVALGRTNDAIRHITRSRDLDPLSTRANNDVGWLYLHVRQPDAAARACQQTLAIDAGALEAQACLERAYTQQRLFDSALLAARATLPASADRPATSTGGLDGLHDIWRWRLQQTERAAATRWISPYSLATLHVLLGDRDRALAALEEAHAKRVGMMVFLARDPLMDPLRDDPRFVALTRRVAETSF